MINSKSYLIETTILIAIAATSFTNFLLFHTIAELFSIIIAFTIFIVAWNTRFFAANNYLLFLGIMYLFVAILDLTHTLAYKGMNIFHDYGANLPTQLWIGARYLESISLGLAPVFLTRHLSTQVIFAVYSICCGAILASLFVWPIFPDCFIEGSGLTPFKKISEYIISLILCGAAIFLNLKRDNLDRLIFNMLLTSIFLTIISELAFTFYVSVYSISNIVGHLFKIISFYLIYRAVIVVTLTTPYKSLFREITKSEKEKLHVINQLNEALDEVKLLEGFLPICASCKQIRDENGHWNQLEQYITDHSEAKFSHSICPKCAKALYPDLKNLL